MSSTPEEITAQITEMGNKIKQAKADKQPKELWDEYLQNMLKLKIQYKELTGNDYGPPPKPKKEKNVGAVTEASDKNKEKRAKKAAEKAAKAAEKERKRAERAAREKEKADKLAGVGADNFGDLPLIRSQAVTNKKWTNIEDLTPALQQKKVLVRGFLQVSRSVGKGVFVKIRSTMFTVQGVCFQNDKQGIGPAMVKYIAGLPIESIVDVEGTVTVPDQPVDSCTQKMVELQISSFKCVTKSLQTMPFQMEDAMRPDEGKESDVGVYEANDELIQKRSDGMATVGLENRLDHRWIDLRTPANQGIFRVESMVGVLFRELLVNKGFIELHSPKLLRGASEGGADVFTLDYFGQTASLAMSPQLQKQQACACAGFEKVFVTGPVFRAENSNTRRHLCEFTGFDLEMVIKEHYDEVLDLFSDLFIHIFDGINKRCKRELEAVREQHPFEDLRYCKPTLKLTYAEGCKLLREAGVDQDDYEDLTTENEKMLGDLVAEKYGTDFFFMDKYPLDVRPFYTMPDPENPRLSNSYDFFIRGQEILSGAQRIHTVDLLEERAKAWGIELEESYVDSFKNGALPHGGGGIGLERVVMLFLGLPNIRKASWFPRDPKRLGP
uniref:aspartate--tRNA ligase n=1 Tax=Pseudo-nitzschia australis TaxID=44445 RepID=A0A7S4AUM4_9STRA|mmetsp:Transcript_7393/g.15849  ORF Transcript_7393/g.15849 Transcript_7393/m.15849 type:complete len:610 (+) Transcript_7393:176-2005(+)|eukprot:CAMPEP_0168193292 /NCGR_PEP_ID=MMETSP0139_2-20121125/18526_1 /TAXON_ID=44445 /ORGANISM="Pseudo-nitzschia australis, Strain 10249 10 AB" /LENGTH=609 /DNA_ID=CAMNT_0008116633 /DNA_START=119 /DNA_END=1948 /DNA_ORIENTATION=-